MKSFNWYDGNIVDLIDGVKLYRTGRFIGKAPIYALIINKQCSFDGQGISQIYDGPVRHILSATLFEGGTTDNGQYWNMVPWVSDVSGQSTKQTRLCFREGTEIVIRRRGDTTARRFKGYIEFI